MNTDTKSPEHRFPKVILATACIPWNADWTVQEDVFRREIEFLAENLTKYLYLFGTAGEGHAVSNRQFRELVRIFHEECRAVNAHPMIGLIGNSVPEIEERIQYCLEEGVSDFQISLPSWGTLTDEEMEVFFKVTCGQFPDGRFLHYNLPRVGRILQPEHYAQLSRAYPNLVAVKHTKETPEKMATYLEAAPTLRFFAGDGLFARIGRTLDVGLLPSLGVVNPERIRAVFKGEFTDLDRHIEELARVSEAVHASGDARGAHIDGAYDKQLYKVHDPEFPLRLLPPYSYCTEEQYKGFLKKLPEGWGAVNG